MAAAIIAVNAIVCLSTADVESGLDAEELGLYA